MLAVDKSIQLAQLLIDVEAQLRQLGLWDAKTPSAEALSSNEPFSFDTLSFEQWLQFVFLPRFYDLLERAAMLPDQCGVAPMAQEYFSGTGLATQDLVATLVRIDELLSGQAS